MKTGAIVLLALGFAGCATLPVDPSKMTAKQLREVVKDKSATLGCATIETPYKGNTIFLNVDKDVLKVGKITVGRDCTVTIENGPPAPK